uniref:Protein phosphatase 1 regulatory subunit 21 n=1 Tax=Petromyzon marinus TaxID=7757 RepID=A0AAJ7T6B6_PETMA|nr:protein phosphatase 1 regulatory subunit 21 isoform X1 [Petromyzon marinus]XP_032812129.1 protein phosphatase 1 regulatory subunit 21 isoform X1 [Petromyzon marinus]
MASETQAKYQKLAQEYAKLRAQNQVLKRAVVDEQEASGVFKEQLKGREQSVRRLEQEMDSLTFRNQQLAKRVELLQGELESMEKRGKKSKPRAGEPVASVPMFPARESVFNEDLQKKIGENEELHKQLYEVADKHEREQAALRERLAWLEEQVSSQDDVAQALRSAHAQTTERLQHDRAQHEVKVQALEREAKECRLRAEECQQQLQEVRVDLGGRLEEATVIIQEHIPFNDTSIPEFNTLNVPTYDRAHQLRARELVGQALLLVKDLVSSLLNFHTYTEQRCLVHPLDASTHPVSPVNQKFCQFLHENASYVRPLDQGMQQLHDSITEDAVTMLETVVSLSPFSDSLSNYVSYLSKLTPYQLESLQEESRSPLCSEELRTHNAELEQDVRAMTAAFSRTSTYVVALTLPGTRPQAMHPDNHGAVYTQLGAALHSLHQAAQGLSKRYGAKVSLEHELPTSSHKLRSTNECLLSSLVALACTTGKIAEFFAGSLDFLSVAPSPAFGRRGAAGGAEAARCVAKYRRKAAQYMFTIQQPPPDSVPYEEAMANRAVLLSSTESREGLAQQVLQTQEKLLRLEQEKEHWLLETQLAQARFEKETARCRQLETRLHAALSQAGSGGSGGSGDGEEQEATTAQEGNVRDAVAQYDGAGASTPRGRLSSSEAEEPSVLEDGREQLIKRHYTARVTQLAAQLQQADSRAVHFHAECRALSKRLRLAEKARQQFQSELHTANQNLSSLQDELTTTKRSYEDQLSMMSDHLCSVNETLATQRDQIDALKLAGKASSKKKSR